MGPQEETYGEDPYLVAHRRCGDPRISRGPPIWDRAHVMATTKHFAVHGQPEWGTNVAPGNYSERVVREYFLKPFDFAVKEAGCATVMASYNEVDGIPSHSNKHFLQGILRQEWGFKGLVVSDYFGITELIRIHHVAVTNERPREWPWTQAWNWNCRSPTLSDLPDQVTREDPGATIDRAVRASCARSSGWAVRRPICGPANAEKIANSPEHRELALKAAHEAIILLKNQNNFCRWKRPGTNASR